jgi:LmbE family N-acetylglucosaminyl deacetylase
MNVLVLAAHPDDESIGVGGTIAALADAGHRVYVATFTNGVGSRIYCGADIARRAWAVCSCDFCRSKTDEAASDRSARFRSACKVLGASESLSPVAWFTDQAMGQYIVPQMRRFIESCIGSVTPAAVYTHSQHDLNLDHRAVYEATLPAVRPKSGVREVYCYPGVRMMQPFAPVRYVDITATAERKWQAMACYGDELQAEVEASRALAVLHGHQAGVPLAEGFEVVRILA